MIESVGLKWQGVGLAASMFSKRIRNTRRGEAKLGDGLLLFCLDIAPLVIVIWYEGDDRSRSLGE